MSFHHPTPCPPGWKLIGADGGDWSWAFVIHRDIPGWPSYMAGSDGTIWSRKSGTWRAMKPGGRNRYGYRQVILYRDGRSSCLLIHRLILQSFRGPAPEALQCRHLDGNAQNNVLDNLVWGTRSQNQRDRVRHGTHNRGEQHPMAILNREAVSEIRANILGLCRRELAERYGVSNSTIKAIRCGRLWSSLG